jgi:hypothetical protein
MKKFQDPVSNKVLTNTAHEPAIRTKYLLLMPADRIRQLSRPLLLQKRQRRLF